jgi:hypothetical protein
MKDNERSLSARALLVLVSSKEFFMVHCEAKNHIPKTPRLHLELKFTSCSVCCFNSLGGVVFSSYPCNLLPELEIILCILCK